MQTHPDLKRQINTVLSLLITSILIDQLIVEKLIPSFSKILGLNPIPVIFGVPVNLPFTMGCIPIFLSFLISYSLFCMSSDLMQKSFSRKKIRARVWKVIRALAIVPLFMISAGFIYLPLHDYLPRALRNSLESFGINADIYSFIPGVEVIHLRGSVFMMMGTILGTIVCTRKLKSILTPANLPPSAPEKSLPKEEALIQLSPKMVAREKQLR